MLSNEFKIIFLIKYFFTFLVISLFMREYKINVYDNSINRLFTSNTMYKRNLFIDKKIKRVRLNK